jgi:type IV fimbrial biogenesis protein FimT
MNPRPARRPPPRAVARGITLIELLVVITIAGLLVVAAVPSFVDYTGNARLREAGHALQAEALNARSEAIRRNRIVRVVTSGSTIRVFEAQDTANLTELRSRTLAGGVTAADATIDFSPRGFIVDRSVSPAVEFAAASVDLAMPGVTCSADQRCPSLRIEAGGGIRLCPNKLSCS